MRPRPITGWAVASALGPTLPDFLRGLREGTPLRSRPRPPSQALPKERWPETLAFEIPGFDPSETLGDKGLRSLDRLTKLLVVAARAALADAGIKRDGEFVAHSPESAGLVASNAYGSLEAIDELHRVATLEDARYINPSRFPNTVSNTASGYVSIWEGLRALNVTVSSGNPGGLDAVLVADTHLSARRAACVVTGGAEAMSEALYVGWRKVGMPTTVPLAEGAALFVLEDADMATARGARVRAHVLGHGAAFGQPEGHALFGTSTSALARAIAQALEDAATDARDVDLVLAGMGGFSAYDEIELSGITRVLGPDVAVAAPKRLLGETFGAAAALSMAAALAWIGEEMPVPLVRGRLAGRPRRVLVTELGFYGNASAVLLGAP